MKNPHVSVIFLFLFLLISAQACIIFRFADAKIHITDDLDDVIDDEEDETWREWGKKKTQPEPFDPPPMDFDKMAPQQMQDEMMKRQFGPVFGFAKLRPGTRRTSEMVSEIAMKWTKVARTGAVEVKFMVVDISTIMFTMQKGQDTLELKEFLLNQSEAYEIKIGDQIFRRPGDPPLEEVFEKLHDEKSSKTSDPNSMKDEKHHEL